MKKIRTFLKKNGKKILLFLLVVFIAIQFFRPGKNYSPGPTGHEFTTVFPVPDTVAAIFKNSCYDCHSNNTVYPWYNHIQPVAWWLARHIQQGKRGLNFDEFATYRPARQYKRLKDIEDEIRDDDMPLSSYTLIHRKTILSDGQKKILDDWCEAMRDSMKMKYPADSLKMPSRK